MSRTDDNTDTRNGVSDDGSNENAAAALLPFALAGIITLCSIGVLIWLWQKNDRPPTRRFGSARTQVDAPALIEIELTERSGRPFRSAELHGDVWVASFFFTTCPGSCKKLNRNIASFQQEEELSGVRWVSITVDPDNDTLEALRQYADRFAADAERWLFCRGTLEYTESLGVEAFKLPVSYKGHNDYGVVVDRNGRVRGWLNINSRRDREKLRALLITCLAEKAPPSEDRVEHPKTTLPIRTAGDFAKAGGV